MVQGGLSVANDVQYRVSRSLTVIMQGYTLLKLQKTAVDISEQFFNISYCSSLALWFLLLSMLKNCHISSDDELCSAIVRAFWNVTNTNLILVLRADGWCIFMYSFIYSFTVINFFIVTWNVSPQECICIFVSVQRNRGCWQLTVLMLEWCEYTCWRNNSYWNAEQEWWLWKWLQPGKNCRKSVSMSIDLYHSILEVTHYYVGFCNSVMCCRVSIALQYFILCLVSNNLLWQ